MQMRSLRVKNEWKRTVARDVCIESRSQMNSVFKNPARHSSLRAVWELV